MQKRTIVDGLRSVYGDVVARQQVLDYCSEHACDVPHWLMNDQRFRVSRGNYRLPTFNDGSDEPAFDENDSNVSNAESVENGSVMSSLSFLGNESLIPKPMGHYVPFGNHADVKAAIKSGLFFPVFITGLSGNGKTTSVRQACAESRRECIRVNITCETDEDDLLGGFRLVNGETKFHYGPVVEAMKRGAVLLLDEIDLASTKIMCLQPILEGNGVFLKKIGEYVEPKEGFTIFATANTKGQGSESGKFVGTNVLNEAFLDRFSATMEQEYPSEATERKILNKFFETLGLEDEDFVNKLVQWAGVSRKSYFDQALDEVISTRRLVHICKSYSIYKDRVKAIRLTTDRFNPETRKALVDLYGKIDATVMNDKASVPTPASLVSVEIPDGVNPFA